MNTKLTLRLDDELIREAKEYSRETGKSVSRLVEDYFALIAARRNRRRPGLSPRVRALAGALKDAEVTEADHRRHLEEKYR
jgi:hypothetical protein